MQCPACETGALYHNRFEHGLPCYLCANCRGALLSLAPYIDWMVNQPKRSAAASVPTFEIEHVDSKKALTCPKCSRIMIKYKVLADAQHGLDFCFGCEEVWLDRGEWEYLKSKGLHTQITAISTDPWQRKLREQYGRDMRAAKFRASLGESAFSEVERFRVWLEGQPARAEIVRYLSLIE